MIKFKDILQESNSSMNSIFLFRKVTKQDAIELVRKILRELPTVYSKDLKIAFGVDKKYGGTEDNASYDRFSNTMYIGKDMFMEHSTDFNYWYDYMKDMPMSKRRRSNLVISTSNAYGLSGKMFGIDNLRNVIYHEIGHKVFHDEELKKPYVKLKNKMTFTVAQYQNYYADRNEEELDGGRFAPKGLFARRMNSEQFAENFRIYWIKKNKKAGK